MSPLISSTVNPKKVTFQAPLTLPPSPSRTAKVGMCFLHVVDTEDGFALRWVPTTDCPIYANTKTGEKMRLTMSLINCIVENKQHDKVILTFEELLSSDDGKKIYNEWKPSEWFKHQQD